MATYLVYFLYIFAAFQCAYSVSVYRCQNETIQLRCPFNDVINITDAFYGRNNRTICSRGNNTQSECSLQNATAIVGDKCNNKTSCTISVNSTDFGNACPELTTHLKVNFTCQGNNNTLQCGKHEHIARNNCDGCSEYCPGTKCLPFCPDPFKNICKCDYGYLRDSHTGRCVLAQYCPQKGDPERNNEEFCECASRQRTCRTPWAFSFFHFFCNPGYGCKEGYLRDVYTQACILPDECPRPYPRW